MKKSAVFLGILTLLICSNFLTGCNLKSDISTDPSDKVVTGTIEVKEVNIASKLPGRILKVMVEQNQSVKAGDVIAVLSNDELKAKEEQAKALVEAADVMLQQAKKAVILQEKISKSNIDKANAGMDTAQYQYEKAKNGARTQEIEQAQIAYDMLEKTYERVKYLADKGAVSQQKADEVKAQRDVAGQRLEIAKDAVRPEDLKTAQAMVAQVQASVDAANSAAIQVELAKQNVEAAKAKYEQALAGLEEVRAYLKDTKIVSPISGTITLLNSKAGELVSSGYPIAVVSDLNDMWVSVKVRETDISKFKINDNFKISTYAFKDDIFEGVVSAVDKKPDFAAKKSTNEKNERDIMAFTVKIKIKNNDKLRPGLTAYIHL